MNSAKFKLNMLDLGHIATHAILVATLSTLLAIVVALQGGGIIDFGDYQIVAAVVLAGIASLIQRWASGNKVDLVHIPPDGLSPSATLPVGRYGIELAKGLTPMDSALTPDVGPGKQYLSTDDYNAGRQNPSWVAPTAP